MMNGSTRLICGAPSDVFFYSRYNRYRLYHVVGRGLAFSMAFCVVQSWDFGPEETYSLQLCVRTH
jgi:hypothetical protein